MLAPRFTIRQLLVITGVCALCVALVAEGGRRGDFFPLSLSIALASLVLTGLIFGAFFLVTWLLSIFVSAIQGKQTPASPFEEHSPPPKIVGPGGPE